MLAGEGRTLDAEGMVRYYEALVGHYPIVSIEDGCAEDDWAGWKLMTGALATRSRIVGDDLFIHQSGAAAARHRREFGQCDPDQGQSDRNAVRKLWRQWRSRTKAGFPLR